MALAAFFILWCFLAFLAFIGAASAAAAGAAVCADAGVEITAIGTIRKAALIRADNNFFIANISVN